MKLATIEQVRLKHPMLFEGEGVDDVIDEALEASTLYLKGVLGTGFDRTTITDTFLIDSVRNPRTGTFTELLLTQGFVDSGQSFTLRLGANVGDVSTQTPLVVVDDYTIRDEFGHIIIHGGQSFDGSGIVLFSSRDVLINARGAIGQIIYTAGFLSQPAVVQVQEIKIPVPLIATDVVSVLVDGILITSTFSSDSNTTLATWAALIQAEPGVATALVTDAGAGSNDDRLVIITSLTAGSASLLETAIITRGDEELEVTQRELTRNQDVDPQQFDLSVVPSWLQEAASIYAVIFINMASRISTDSGNDNTNIQSNLKQLNGHLSVILDDHIRSFGAAIKPLF